MREILFGEPVKNLQFEDINLKDTLIFLGLIALLLIPSGSIETWLQEAIQ